MLISRAKAAVSATPGSGAGTQKKQARSLPTLDSFLRDRDYSGAITLLEFERSTGTAQQPTNFLWTAYAAFHMGDYPFALQIYQELCHMSDADPVYFLYLGICQFYLGMYQEADASAKKGPTCKLQNRLQFHLSHKFNDEKRLMWHHQHLQDVVEDQLTLASVHYLRGHYQEAIDIYKRLLGDHPEHLALNVYLALCYYKLDYYDVAQEVLSLYLQKYPTSVTACNLKACNHFRLYNGKAAELELRGLLDQFSPAAALAEGDGSASGISDNADLVVQAFLNQKSPGTKSALKLGRHHRRGQIVFAQDIIRHNLVVFRGGEGAPGALGPLVDVVPEARLNLAVYHLKHDDVGAAYELLKDMDAASPAEYILKAVVNTAVGQAQDSRDHLKQAQQYFQLVGSSTSECDTIAGRQCMASCYFLLRQFDDVLIYLNSIKSYFFNDDAFNLNFAQVKAGLNEWAEAEEALLLIQSDKIKSDFTYISHLAKCYIMNKKARQAWELYLRMDTSSESLTLLQLVAHDSYRTGQYLWAAKAFGVLERLDPGVPEHWEGKRGACAGVFRDVVSGNAPKETLRDVLPLLRHSAHPQANSLLRTIRSWAKM